MEYTCPYHDACTTVHHSGNPVLIWGQLTKKNKLVHKHISGFLQTSHYPVWWSLTLSCFTSVLPGKCRAELQLIISWVIDLLDFLSSIQTVICFLPTLPGFHFLLKVFEINSAANFGLFIFFNSLFNQSTRTILSKVEINLVDD